MPGLNDLHQYQHDIANFIVQKQRCAVFAEMGLGKTVSVLTALSCIHAENPTHKTLIIAPKRVIETVWPAEIEKWDHVRHLTFSSMVGTATQRLDALRACSDLYLISRDNVAWLVEQLRKWPFHNVVIDESSSFKSPKSERFKQLRRAAKAFQRVVLMSGTPAPNALWELWPQMALMKPGLLGSSFSEFKRNHCDENEIYHYLRIKPGHAKIIHSTIEPYCRSLRADEYLQLPPVTHNYVDVRLPKEAAETYSQMERDFMADAANGVVTAANAAVQVGKLLQITNGFLYAEGVGDSIIRLHDEKLNALEEIVDGSPGENILVSYLFRADLEALKSRFPKAVALDKNNSGTAICAWNDGLVRMLLVHPASAGHGLNLQHGGRTIVWFGVPWSLELYLQLNARLLRQGQTKPVLIHHILALDTVDYDVASTLDAKQAGLTALLNAVRMRRR